MSAPRHPSPPSADGRLLIDLSDMSAPNTEVAGSLPVEIFDLEPGGPRPLSPLHYRLHVHHQEDQLTVTGELNADFSFECVRCLEPFTDRITLDGYFIEQQLDGKTLSVDLTDSVREDMLLALPDHPRCEEASLHPRVCSAATMFTGASQHSLDHSEETSTRSDSQDLWGALDQLKLQAPAPSPENSRRNR